MLSLNIKKKNPENKKINFKKLTKQTSQNDLFKHSARHVESCILHYLFQNTTRVLTALSIGTVGG